MDLWVIASSQGKITLADRKIPQIARRYMDFLMVDNLSAYHGVLERSSLKELWAITSIHHFCMKFSMEHDLYRREELLRRCH